ncbi:MAG: FAD-binding oxidoreductase [Desulfohalobiaceae bacterium]|nr:FAD-binding oxidoreductase [Desulfohalobiaceae bacterium]
MAGADTSHKPLSSRTDILIIGSGLTGITAALRLGQNGARVLVLDRGSLGSAASSRNGGLVLTGLNADLHSLTKTNGRSAARRLFGASLSAVECIEDLVKEGNIDCAFQRCGHLQAAYRSAHLESLRKEQALLAESFNYETSLLGANEIRTELDSNFYCGGLLHPLSGEIQPAKFVAGLGRMAAEAGVELHSGADVLEVGRQSGHFIVKTNRKTIVADQIVVATNGYTGPQFPWLQRRIVPVDSLIIATKDIPWEVAETLIPQGRVVSDTKRFLFYFRLSPDKKSMLFGGRPRFLGKGLNDNARRMHQDMLKVFPQLSGIGISHAWTGRVGFTRDFLPHLGRCKGIYYALGYCGHGVALATYLGDRLAAWMQGVEESPLFSQIRFPAFPLYSGRPWFLPLVHTYYSFLDRLPMS